LYSGLKIILSIKQFSGVCCHGESRDHRRRPGWAHLALLLKQADPKHQISVLERNQPDSTFGWGVVFSDRRSTTFARPTSLPTARSPGPSPIGMTSTSTSRGPASPAEARLQRIARKKLLQILQQRAREVGVDLRFQAEVAGLESLKSLGLDDADLIVAADGVNSTIRRQTSRQIPADLDVRSAKFVCSAPTSSSTPSPFTSSRTSTESSRHIVYRFDADTSTFIVECDPASWKATGFDKLDTAGTVAACEKMFAPWLKGHKLMSNAAHMASPWVNFVRVRNAKWFHQMSFSSATQPTAPTSPSAPDQAGHGRCHRAGAHPSRGP